MKLYISKVLIKFSKGIWQHLSQKSKTNDVTGVKISKW